MNETEACRAIIDKGATLTDGLCVFSAGRKVDKISRKGKREIPRSDGGFCGFIRDKQNQLHEVCTNSYFDKVKECREIEDQETCN